MFRNVFSLAFLLILFSTNSYADGEISGVAGVNLWSVPDTSTRYLPNYNTPRTWHEVSEFIKVKGSYSIDNVTLSGAAKFDSNNGHRIDRLDIDYKFNNAVGIRAGLLPYRISWCRTYEFNSPWISEPDAFCRFYGLAEISEGSSGVQVYSSSVQSKYLVDGMIGYYNPMIDGQDKKLGPYIPVGPTVYHEKYGASINILDLSSGLEIRASWLHSQQNQDSSSGSFQRRLNYETFYLASEFTPASHLDIRASISAYIGQQGNPVNLYDFTGISSTLEASYKVDEYQTLSLGLSNYSNTTIYKNSPGKEQTLDVPSMSLSYRRELPKDFYLTLQVTHSKDTYIKITNDQAVSSGSAFGLQIAKQF